MIDLKLIHNPMKLLSYPILLLLLVLSSCDKAFELEPSSNQQIDTRSGRVAGREILVMDISQTRQKGKLNNPYYVGSIRNAYNYLKSSRQITGTYNITPNRLYIRYLPKNEEELYLLETSENFEVFEYPLQDNDLLVTTGHGYDDPELAEGQLPFQYTVCGFGEIEGGIEVDILDSLFLNEPNPTIPVEDWKKIEAQSLLSTGVIQQGEVESLIFCNDWNPSGTINIWDDALATTIPGKKVKVKASRFFKYWTGYTNNVGYFILPDFCGEVRYSIIWENQIWDIRNKKGQQATTEGPRQRAPWNPVIKDDKEALGFATVHRTLVRYFFEDVAELRRPFPLPFQKLKVKSRHEDGPTNGVTHTSGFEGFFSSHVVIFGYNGSSLRPTHALFSTTAHELGHVAHAFQMGNIQFWQVSNLITESWARACQWKVTELEYGGSPFPVPGAIQDWFYDQNPNFNDYSPLFIDLEDSFNQNPTNIPNRPFDLTSGYNLNLLQSNVLGHSYGLSSLRDRLKSQKPSGVTDGQIDANLQHFFDNF